MPFEDRIRLPVLNLIHRRPRLLERLTEYVESGKRLITIYAPGGYGKSILLADFAQTTDRPVCWCSLDASDRDPTYFLTLLATSIIDRFHFAEGERLLTLVQQGDTQASVHRIAELLATVSPHLIIVDDYHKAVSPGVTLALNRLLRLLPDSSSMIVAARGDMGLETGQIIDLLMADRAAGLSEVDLRFNGAEIQRAMLKRFGRPIKPGLAEEIARSTDGNIAQILLTGHIVQSGQGLGDLRRWLGADRAVIYNYLATEVLGKQPPARQWFMLHSAVLPDMTVELCNELLGITDAQSYLDALVHHDLFISQTGTGFRYHDLFANFLRSKLAEDDQVYRPVALRAAQVLTTHARFEEAISLCLGLQAWDEAARLLEEKGAWFYHTGRASTLHTWLEQLSPAKLERSPRLLLLQGQILNNDRGNLPAALALFEQAEAQFRVRGEGISVYEARMWQAVALRMMGRIGEGLAQAIDSVARLQALLADPPIMAWAIENRGKAYSTAGQIEPALADLRQALAMFETLGDTYRVGGGHHDIGVCLEKMGNIRGAEYHYRQALRVWEVLGNANYLSNTLNSLGVCACLQGDYAQALGHFEESFVIAQRIESPRRAAYALAGIGDAYLADEKYEQAIETLTLSIEYAEQAGVRSLVLYNQIRLGECYLHLKNLGQALALTKQALDITAEMGLNAEYGLACVLQAKIYVQQGQYEAGFKRFAEALPYVENDFVEHARLRLWWGYGLLLDFRPTAAFDQLHEVFRLSVAMGDLVAGLNPTLQETQPLLWHFFHRADTIATMPDSLKRLLTEKQGRIFVTSPGVQVFTLGKPTLIVAGRAITFGQRGKTQRMPEFLLYLLLEGQYDGCRWNEVCAALWPDLDEAKASITFHQYLKRLREATLGNPDTIAVKNDYYQFEAVYLHWCDVLAFDTLFNRAAQAPPAEALSLRLELISLYQGEFLSGFELGEWGEFQRQRFEVAFLQTVTLAAQQLINNTMAQSALAVINRGLAQDYFREDLHCLAFEALAQLGLYNQLAHHYTEMSRIFNEDLGAPPDLSTTQLYQKLIAQR